MEFTLIFVVISINFHWIPSEDSSSCFSQFQPNWKKDIWGRNLISTTTRKFLMTSSNFSVWRDFVPEYHYAKFGVNWSSKKVRYKRGTLILPSPTPSPPKKKTTHLPIWYQNSPAWIWLNLWPCSTHCLLLWTGSFTGNELTLKFPRTTVWWLERNCHTAERQIKILILSFFVDFYLICKWTV